MDGIKQRNKYLKRCDEDFHTKVLRKLVGNEGGPELGGGEHFTSQ